MTAKDVRHAMNVKLSGAQRLLFDTLGTYADDWGEGMPKLIDLTPMERRSAAVLDHLGLAVLRLKNGEPARARISALGWKRWLKEGA